jgi:hypothetical protein
VRSTDYFATLLPKTIYIMNRISLMVASSLVFTVAVYHAPVIRADIIGFTGAIEIVTTSLVPIDIRQGNWENSTNIRAFEERNSVQLPSSINIDIDAPGTYGRNFGFTPSTQSIAANTLVNSFYVHFDPQGSPGNLTLNAALRFETPILGVIVGVFDGNNVTNPSNTLGLSHPVAGIPGTIYDTFVTDLFDGGGDQLSISSDRRTLNMTLISGPGSDNFRVITSAAVPEPTSFSLITLSSLQLTRMRRRRSTASGRLAITNRSIRADQAG